MTYITNFPKLENTTKMKKVKVYRLLGKLSTSQYYGMNGRQIKNLLPWSQAYRYLTYLSLQNESNKSLLYQVSEASISKEQSKKASINIPLKDLELLLQD